MQLRREGRWQGQRPTLLQGVWPRVLAKLLPEPVYESAVMAVVRTRVEFSLGQLEDDGYRGFDLPLLARSVRGQFLRHTNGMPLLPYTHRHSVEVGLLAFVLANELRKNGHLSALPVEIAETILAAGLFHDVGKSFIPRGILGKEIPAGPRDFRIAGVSLSDAERRTIIGKGHVAAAVQWLKGLDFPYHKLIVDCVGCHHISFDGSDHPRSPSYPEGWIGREQPLHKRILKLCDLVSARLKQRFYRSFYGEADDVVTLEQSLAFAMTVQGTEVDSFLVPFLLAGIYDIPLSDAEALAQYAEELAARERTEKGESVELCLELAERIARHELFQRFVTPENRTPLAAYRRLLTDSHAMPLARAIHEQFGGELDFP